MGKLTPGKNPGTTGSAGRSDPARDACGRPRAFHLLFFHTFHHFWFLGNHSPGGKVESWRILRLRWRLFSGLGCFLFFLPNWALCGPNRPLTGRRRVVPPPGAETGYTGPTGGNQGACRFCGAAECGWFPQVPEGTQNSARGGDGIGVTCQGFPKGARRQCARVYSSAFTQYVGDFFFLNTR